jgi:hypothetical protein
VVVVLKSVIIVVKNVLTSGIEGCKMNKRIEKLFNEAGFHKPEMERLGIEHKFEKFAELIVEEYAREYQKLVDGHSIVLPKNREHAENMVRVGMFYLENN